MTDTRPPLAPDAALLNDRKALVTGAARGIGRATAEALARFGADAATALGPLHVVVNNAGGGFLAEFLETSPKGQAALIDENFSSVTHVVRAAVPGPAPRRRIRAVGRASVDPWLSI